MLKMMNSLRQILFRNSFLTLPKHVMFSTFTQNGTNVEIQQDEPDKLYKFVELEFRGNDPAVLKSVSKFSMTIGDHFDINTKSWTLRKPRHERYTVLKSVHIYKKHRVQYEYRTYYSFVQYKHLTGSTTDTLLEYIERNLPEGVALKATKVEVQPLPEYLTSPDPHTKSISSETEQNFYN